MPVDYGTAKRTYDKLVREKMAKGYTEGPEARRISTPRRRSGLQGFCPSCSTRLTNPTLNGSSTIPVIVPQEKYDGRRMLVRKHGAEIHGINRKGLLVGLPEPVFQAVQAIPGDFILDGEAWATSCGPSISWTGTEKITVMPYQQRYVHLLNLLGRPCSVLSWWLRPHPPRPQEATLPASAP